MKAFAAAAAALFAAAPAFAAPAVELRDAAARLVVIPEARADVAVTVSGGDPRLPPLQPRREGDKVVLDGGLDRRIANCSGSVFGWNGHRSKWGEGVEVRGIGRIPFTALPVVTARVPMDAAVAGGGAVWGEVGPTDRLSLAHSGCGDWKIGPVRDRLEIASHGSGDTRARTAGRLSYASQGSGDLEMDGVAGRTDLSLSGSGDVKIGRVDGVVSESTAGSGDVRIADGRAPAVNVNIAGSGDFSFGGEAGALSASVAGSGDVRVARVTGPVAKQVRGSGEVTVGR